MSHKTYSEYKSMILLCADFMVKLVGKNLKLFIKLYKKMTKST